MEDGGADAFRLVETVDRLHQRIVVGDADGPDRWGDALKVGVFGVSNRRLLRGGIRVVDQVPWRDGVSFVFALPQGDA